MKFSKLIRIAIIFSFIAPVAAQAQSGALPHILVYKTAKDYSKYVAVELTADKKAIASYPAPGDVSATAKMKPVKLHKGYLMSRTGISVNTAYLNITTEAYRKLGGAPSQEEMMKKLKAKNPVTELWDCGKRGELTESQINDMIDKGQLKSKCKKIK